MSIDDLDNLLSLARGTVFPTWRLLDSSVCTILCLPSEIALSAKMFAPSFAGSPRCAFTLTNKVAVPAAILFCSISLAEYPRQVPPPTLPFRLHQSTYWLPSTMTGCNTATAPVSACHEAAVKTLPIQADLSWSLLIQVALCTAASSFFFSS